MSAITAIFRLDGKPVEERLVNSVLDRLSHRGDDDERAWVKRNIGLGHRMRWTTPESQFEVLPTLSADGNAAITFDGRIDNREELFRELSFSGKPLSQISDSEIVLASYEKWGTDCLPRLIGDFVFAIWNERERTLFAARDPLGIKHFYYFYQPGKIFSLASEIKALFAIDEVPRRLNEQHLGDYLVVNSEDKVNTFYKDICRLPSSHALLVSESGFRTWQYWKPAETQLRLKNAGEYHEMFRERFSAAVTARLRSAYPVGSMLSGGLDSSSIVCVADNYLKKNNRPSLHTFSAIFPETAKVDPRVDERRFMRSVIERTGCVPHYVDLDGSSPFSEIEKIQWHCDHPVGAPIRMDWEIFKSAQLNGVKTVLSGFDGDSTVSHGYEDLSNFAYRHQYIRLVRESIALKRNMPRRSHSLKRLVWQNGIARNVPNWVYSTWRKIRRRDQKVPIRSRRSFPLHAEIVDSGFKKENDLDNRIIKLRAENFPNDISPIEHHWNALRNGHFSQVLENVEKASAAFGVDARFPFFDRPLVEFCISLPPGQRIYKGWTRSIFRHAMRGIVPDQVLWRTDKSNIGAHVKLNMLKHGADQLGRLVGSDSHYLEGYVDLDLLRSVFSRYEANPIEKEPEALLMLTNVCLLNWLEQSRRADGTASRPVRSATSLVA